MRLRREGLGHRAAPGFTLLEVVLALVIFSMIALLVYGAFDIGHRAVIAGERDADVNQRMRLAEEVLGRQVRSTVRYFARHDDENVPYFLGRSDGMSFVTSAPQSRGGTGLGVVTYRVVDGQLVLEERTDFTPDDLYKPPSDARIERAVLLNGFSSLRFEYLARDEGDWQNKWDAREDETLPSAVRITIDGLPFFQSQPWVQEIPLMTIASGWGMDDEEPPDDDEVDTAANGSAGANGDQDAADPDLEEDTGDEDGGE